MHQSTDMAKGYHLIVLWSKKSAMIAVINAPLYIKIQINSNLVKHHLRDFAFYDQLAGGFLLNFLDSNARSAFQ